LIKERQITWGLIGQTVAWFPCRCERKVNCLAGLGGFAVLLLNADCRRI